MIAFYFSGTGNSEYIARKFSAQMDIPCHSIEEDLRFHELLIRHSRIVICYPIYCSGIPRLMREFAQKYRKDFYQKRVLVFCTQMLYSGDGARAFLDLFPENWLILAYAEHFFMPNNICNVFPAWTFGKKVVTHEIRRANRKIEKIRQDLYAGKVRRRGCNPLSRRLGWWQRKYFPATEEKAKDNVRIHSDCIGCGRCARNCPVQNLLWKDGHILPQGNCMFCYRCVNLCPQKAITVVYHRPVSAQYKGPVAQKERHSLGKYAPEYERK